jgi:hypothetical protein
MCTMKVAKCGETWRGYKAVDYDVFYVFLSCVLAVPFNKREVVPGVRQLVASLFIADAQVRCQPSPCEPFSVPSVSWTEFSPRTFALPYQYHVTSDPCSYFSHVLPML